MISELETLIHHHHHYNPEPLGSSRPISNETPFHPPHHAPAIPSELQRPCPRHLPIPSPSLIFALRPLLHLISPFCHPQTCAAARHHNIPRSIPPPETRDGSLPDLLPRCASRHPQPQPVPPRPPERFEKQSVSSAFPDRPVTANHVSALGAHPNHRIRRPEDGRTPVLAAESHPGAHMDCCPLRMPWRPV